MNLKFIKRLPVVLACLSCAGLVPNAIIMRWSSIYWALPLRVCSISATGSFPSRQSFFWLTNSCVNVESFNFYLLTCGLDFPHRVHSFTQFHPSRHQARQLLNGYRQAR